MHVQGFLCHFGYFRKNSYDSQVLEENTSENFPEIQRFYGLTEMKTFTEQTRELMTKSRCLVPDILADTAIDFTALCP
ncbi:hypothetical protein CO726_28235 [Bacillus fungorum]|uniref:Uncharacterized protein n=1 Tax=Bacillus fungorum TaxID=2039284 RepID=A0A2G6Q5M8_9BACI|nr:hypothetical protein CO726_28235 [Bacillus fungorum]